MKSIKVILILILATFSFFLIRGSVYPTSDSPIADSTTIPLESNPRCIAINPVTDQAVVTGMRPNQVCVIDLSTGALLATLPAGKFPLGVESHRH
jgi:DNA-binding beta-propeller fold protein YncE